MEFSASFLHPKLGKKGLWANLLGWSMLNLGYMNFSKSSHPVSHEIQLVWVYVPLRFPQNGAKPNVLPFLMEVFPRRSEWSGDPRWWRRLSYRKPLRRGQGTTETSSRWTFCWLIYDSQEELVSISNIMHHSSQWNLTMNTCSIFCAQKGWCFYSPWKKGVTWRDNVWKAPESGWEPIQNVPEVPQPRAIPPQKDVAFCTQGSVAYRHSNHSNQLCQAWPVLGKCWGWLMNRFSRLQEISFPSEDWAAILSLVWQNVQVHMFIVC